MKFLVDGMLGDLARWLRITGQSTEYDPWSEDETLLMKAQKAGMTLLTCDEELTRKAISKKIGCLRVRGDSEAERLANVSRAFGLSLDTSMDAALCPECGNGLRRAAGKEELGGRVPPESLQVYSEFWVCKGADCQKVYWKGSHWKQIQNTVNMAKTLASNANPR